MRKFHEIPQNLKIDDVNTLNVGETCLESIRAIANGKYAVCIAERLERVDQAGADTSINLLAEANLEDERFSNPVGITRAWMNGTLNDLQRMFDIDFTDKDGKLMAISSSPTEPTWIKLKNPMVHLSSGQQVRARVQVVETLVPTEYDLGTNEEGVLRMKFTAKRTRNGEYFIKNGKLIFPKNVVIGNNDPSKVIHTRQYISSGPGTYFPGCGIMTWDVWQESKTALEQAAATA